MCQGRKRNPWNERAGNLSVPAAFKAERTSYRVRELKVLVGSQAGGEPKQKHLGGGDDAHVPCSGHLAFARTQSWSLTPAKAFRCKDLG